MRIIAGSHRGKKLIEYYSPNTRPTTDRVKENVFNLLSNYLDLNGVRVLDLFAGTGAYGIECLSRGAGYVHFNDYDAKAVAVIKKNLAQIWHNYCVGINASWVVAYVFGFVLYDYRSNTFFGGSIQRFPNFRWNYFAYKFGCHCFYQG